MYVQKKSHNHQTPKVRKSILIVEFCRLTSLDRHWNSNTILIFFPYSHFFPIWILPSPFQNVFKYLHWSSRDFDFTALKGRRSWESPLCLAKSKASRIRWEEENKSREIPVTAQLPAMPFCTVYRVWRVANGNKQSIQVCHFSQCYFLYLVSHINSTWILKAAFTFKNWVSAFPLSFFVSSLMNQYVSPRYWWYSAVSAFLSIAFKKLNKRNRGQIRQTVKICKTVYSVLPDISLLEERKK